MDDIVKYILLGLLLLPFVALLTDAIGKTEGMMLRVVVGVALVSFALAFLGEGHHQRPNVAKIFACAFFAWPMVLLIAKGVNAPISWTSIWCSIPIMSWYLVNVSTQFYFPDDRPGLGAGFGLFFGWINMLILFVPLLVIFLGVRFAVQKWRRHR